MKYTLFLCALLISAHLSACDVCGGVSSNTSVGLFASARFHIFGLHGGYRYYETFLYGIRHSREHIFTTELRFRLQLHRRFQLMGFVPYQFAI